ncbi:MAG: alanine--glyoxylate aminotransferase family protein [bacterium]|nr:alanine--glyoxylate aminotransferase family protein [bacterium]
MGKTYLLTPGPCPVPPRVGLAVARPVIHHRSDEYHALHAAVTAGLRSVLCTAGDVLLFACTGTGVMEAAVSNLLSPGDEAVVVRGGKFGDRWAEICAAFGARVVPVDVEWGEAVSPGDVAAALRRHPAAKAVFSTLCETSTGVKTDIEALGRVAGGGGAALVVDATSGLCCSEFRMDDWGVDVAVAGCQKGLMCPTGLGIAVVGSRRARALIEKSSAARYYYDWRPAIEAAGRSETAWSSPAALVAGLAEALDGILAEGLEACIARHRRLGEACRAGVAGMGLRLLAPDAPADGLTAVRTPDRIDADLLRERMRERYGVLVAGGQGRLRGRIIRIAHMGYAGPFDVVTALAALGMALADLGRPVEIGRGLAAAAEVLREP